MSNARQGQTIARGNADDEPAAVTTWTVQARGVRRLPRRLVFTLADFSRPLWWSTVVAVPAVLLAAAVSVGDLFAYLFTMYAAAILMVLSQTSERFVDTTVTLDQDVGELVATYRMGDPTLFGSGHEVAASFDDVDAARFVSFADQTMVRLYHGRPLAEGTAFPVPPHGARQLRACLRRHDVPIRRDAGAGTGWLRWRCAGTVLGFGVVPVCALFVWPVYYSWGFLLVVAVHSIVLPLQGP